MMVRRMSFSILLRGILFLGGVSWLVLLPCPGFSAPVEDMVTVTVKEGQNLRDLARQYLNDADLWTEILRVNNLGSVMDVAAGMKLNIPVQQVALADRELAAALDDIQKATKAGARFLAPDLISGAIRLHEQAIEKRKSRDWQDCRELAGSARLQAQKAQEESRNRNDVSAEAILNDLRGGVHSRKPSDLLWKDALLYARLIEQEKIRTLSQSLAEIIFRDESRLRLYENSQAVIQRMSVNLLENKHEASVSLIDGDIYALLAGSPRKKFQVDVPGVTTKVNSTNFWVNRSQGKALFANYQGELEVTSQGSTVILARNQGTKVDPERPPSSPQPLLSSPVPSSPGHHGTVYPTPERDEVTFGWNPVEGASGYWLEVGLERSSFKNLVLSQKNIRSTQLVMRRPEPGVYYWTVSAIDKYGFPGERSEARLVKVIKDTMPPFLFVRGPKDGALLTKSSVTVAGETEEDAKLHFGGQPVDLSPSGTFAFPATLSEGLNRLSLEAVDRAGNNSRLTLSVTYVPNKKVLISPDPSLIRIGPDHFIAGSSLFTYRGRTEPESVIEVLAAGGPCQARTFSDAERGEFALCLPLPEEKNEFEISVTTPAKDVSKTRFTVDRDLTPPEIRLDAEPPRFLGGRVLRLKGSVAGGTALRLNGREVALRAGIFEEALNLEPGKNRVLFEASDLVGNTALLEREIVLDEKPPALLKFDISEKAAIGGGTIHILVLAKDDSGLRKAARLTLQAGDWVHIGFLRLRRGQDAYEAAVNIPAGVNGQIKLTVELEDHSGNRREYSLIK